MKFNPNWNIFIYENAFENVIRKMTAIFCGFKMINYSLDEWSHPTNSKEGNIYSCPKKKNKLVKYPIGVEIDLKCGIIAFDEISILSYGHKV